MSVKRIAAHNFKSFRDIDIDLGDFNVLLGSNASGKSNFVELFRFLRDVAKDGLDNAVSMQGDVDYLRNLNLGPTSNLSLEVTFDRNVQMIFARGVSVREFIIAQTNQVVYRLEIGFSNHGNDFEIVEDKIVAKDCEFLSESIVDGAEEDAGRSLGRGQIAFVNRQGDIDLDFSLPPGLQLDRGDLFLRADLFEREKLAPGVPLLNAASRYGLGSLPPIDRFVREFATYDFDPKLPKRSVAITGKKELEEDGSNLAIVLKNIVDNRESRKQLFSLLTDILPFVQELNIAKFADKSLLLNVQEAYEHKQPVPASSISDGTINLTALIIALYFGDNSLVTIEEPERNIHPHLISKAVNMLKEASESKQIIITTHSPEIVRHSGLENILFVARDKEGFSTISRPSEEARVQNFLAHEIGIEDLFVKDLLK